METVTLYAVTLLFSALLLLPLHIFKAFSTRNIVILLFAVDTAFTLDAAYNADIVLIAILHVVTIPAFFILIYLDLIKEHRKQFTCFLCRNQIEAEESAETIKRAVDGRLTDLRVHTACINLSSRNRKALSERLFKKGIPK